MPARDVVTLADTLETTERERDEARDALRRLKSRLDERRLPCDGDARAEAAMARDAADEADPAWWRGHDAAVRGMMTVVRRALTEPPRGVYGSEEAREVDASVRALRTKIDDARREGAEEIMAMGDPWPLHDVLAKLAEASRALLGRYNYDGHGWELILAACESADAIIARIRTRARTLPLNAALAAAGAHKETT